MTLTTKQNKQGQVPHKVRYAEPLGCSGAFQAVLYSRETDMEKDNDMKLFEFLPLLQFRKVDFLVPVRRCTISAIQEHAGHAPWRGFH